MFPKVKRFLSVPLGFHVAVKQSDVSVNYGPSDSVVITKKTRVKTEDEHLANLASDFTRPVNQKLNFKQGQVLISI